MTPNQLDKNFCTLLINCSLICLIVTTTNCFYILRLIFEKLKLNFNAVGLFIYISLL